MRSFLSSDFSSWALIIGMAIIAFVMLLGNILRRRIKFFRNLLFPTAIIAGFIGLGLKYFIFYLPDMMSGIFNGYTSPFLAGLKTNVGNFNWLLQSLTYHFLALGFIAMGLKSVKDKKTSKLKGRPVKTGLLIVNTYLLQAIVGLVFTIILGFIFVSVAKYSGILLPLGFGQGPGQANNIGSIFELQGGFAGGQSFGLMVATIGFIWASAAGIFYINKRAKEGVLTRVGEEKTVNVNSSHVESEGEIPVSEAIDKMSIQIIFILIVYAIAYGFIYLLTYLIGSGSDFANSISSLIWGFNFIFGMLFAILFKTVLNALHKKKIVTRKYTNEYMLNRLSGVLFDFMVVASLMSINLESLANTGLLITLILITTAGGLATYFYLLYVTKKIYFDYQHEAFAVLFGNLTGTAPNGIALLREIDPNFETPAADDLVTGSSTAILFGAPILLITGLIYLPNWYYLWGSFALIIVLFVVFNVFMLKEKKIKEDTIVENIETE